MPPHGQLLRRRPRVLSAASLAEITKAQPSRLSAQMKGTGAAFGLGWNSVSFPEYDAQGIEVRAKNGGSASYAAQVLTDPTHRLTVAVMGAGAAGDVMTIALNMFKALCVQKGLMKDESPGRHQAGAAAAYLGGRRGV